jgi:hypothetical protein
VGYDDIPIKNNGFNHLFLQTKLLVFKTYINLVHLPSSSTATHSGTTAIIAAHITTAVHAVEAGILLCTALAVVIITVHIRRLLLGLLPLISTALVPAAIVTALIYVSIPV